MLDAEAVERLTRGRMASGIGGQPELTGQQLLVGRAAPLRASSENGFHSSYQSKALI